MKTVLITGATGEVGKGIVKQLIKFEQNNTNGLKIVICARTLQKAENFIVDLLTNSFPSLENVQLLPWKFDLLQTNYLEKSLNDLLALLEKNGDNLEFLFFNAGIICANGMNYNKAFRQLLTDVKGFFTKPEFINQTNPTVQLEQNTELKKVFVSNVLSHYILAKAMLSYISKKDDRKITFVWTGSTEGTYESFDHQDIQCSKRKANFYGSSKYLMQVASEHLNTSHKNVQSFVVNPNTVASPMSREITPSYMLPFVYMISIIFRFVFDIKQIISNGFLAASVHQYLYENHDQLYHNAKVEGYTRFDAVSINNRTNPTIVIEKVVVEPLTKDQKALVIKKLEEVAINIQ